MKIHEWETYEAICNVPQVAKASAALNKCVPLLERARLEMQSIMGIQRKLANRGELSSIAASNIHADEADMAFRQIIKMIDDISDKYGSLEQESA